MYKRLNSTLNLNFATNEEYVTSVCYIDIDRGVNGKSELEHEQRVMESYGLNRHNDTTFHFKDSRKGGGKRRQKRKAKPMRNYKTITIEH